MGMLVLPSSQERLVEIIPAETTSGRLWPVEQYCKTMGKVIIVCKDRPGFVVNRFFVPWINEACRLLEEESPRPRSRPVACREFRIGLGPFGLMNLTDPRRSTAATTYPNSSLSSIPGADNMRAWWRRARCGNRRERNAPKRSKKIKERLMGQAFAVCSQIVEKGYAAWRTSTGQGRVAMDHGPLRARQQYRVMGMGGYGIRKHGRTGITRWFSGRSELSTSATSTLTSTSRYRHGPDQQAGGDERA